MIILKDAEAYVRTLCR